MYNNKYSKYLFHKKEMSMQKILVIGSPGSGKSTFAVQLSKQLDLPVIHLDKLNWIDDKNTLNPAGFDELLEKVLKKDSWIIDGNYSRTLSKRLGTWYRTRFSCDRPERALLLTSSNKPRGES